MTTPQAGSIGLTQIEGRVGAGIRIAQGLAGSGWSEFEHAFIVGSDGAIVEAEPGGSRIGTLAEYQDGRPLAFIAPPSIAVGDNVARFAAEHLLKVPYSAADYLAIAMIRRHIPGARTVKAYVGDSGHMICSQLCDYAAACCGWKLFDDGRWFGDVTPGDLWEICGRTAMARLGRIGGAQ